MRRETGQDDMCPKEGMHHACVVSSAGLVGFDGVVPVFPLGQCCPQVTVRNPQFPPMGISPSFVLELGLPPKGSIGG